MFPTQSKVNRLGQLWLLPVVTLALLLVGYVAFAGSTAQAQTPTGDYCIEGIVINWEEEPLAGWAITLTGGGLTMPLTTASAPEPDPDDDDPDFERGEFEFDDLSTEPGLVYTVTIESREGWEGVTPTTLSFPIEGGLDDCVQIRFKMRRVVTVVVYKIDADHVPLNDWIISAIPGKGNLFATPFVEETGVNSIDGITGTLDVAGTAIFTLTPGQWIFEERAPKGSELDDMTGEDTTDGITEAYRPVVPPNAKQTLDIDFDDDITSIVFKNELVTGCLRIRKDASTGVTPAAEIPGLGSVYNVAGWGFQLQRTDGTVVRQGVTNGNGELVFDNLPLGPYVIVEEDRPGWNEIIFEEQDYFVSGNACDDEDATIVFTNEQDDSGFCIEGRKIDAEGGYGISGWEIDAEPLDDEGFDPPAVFTNGIGEFTITFPRDDYRVPGGLFEVCEEDVDGWLPHTPSCVTVRLPEWPSACIELPDFVNQQVGHTESEKYGDKGEFDLGEYEDYLYDQDTAKVREHKEKDFPDYGIIEAEPKGNKGSHGGGSCNTYHTVKSGEGLFSIGSHYKISPQAMLDANPDVKGNKDYVIVVGQRICIP